MVKSSNRKFTFEEKLEIVTEYKKGIYTMKEISEIKNVSISSISCWNSIYDLKGPEGLKSKNRERKRIPQHTKDKIIRDYSRHTYTLMELALKYDVSKTSVARIVSEYYETIN